MAASKDKARAILSYATPNPVGPYRLTTPPPPDLGRKTQTPVTPIMGGALVNLPTPVTPTKQTTPAAPPMADKLVNVPEYGDIARVVKAANDSPKTYKLTDREFGYSAYGKVRDAKGKPFEVDVSVVAPGGPGRYELPYNQVRAFDPKTGKEIGHLEWSANTGEILSVKVDGALRRRGIATDLLRIAQQQSTKYEHVNPPIHSRDRTPMGDAWAQKVGGSLPALPTEAETESRRRRIAVSNLQRAGITNPTESDIQGQFEEWRRRGVV